MPPVMSDRLGLSRKRMDSNQIRLRAFSAWTKTIHEITRKLHYRTHFVSFRGSFFLAE